MHVQAVPVSGWHAGAAALCAQQAALASSSSGLAVTIAVAQAHYKLYIEGQTSLCVGAAFCGSALLSCKRFSAGSNLVMSMIVVGCCCWLFVVATLCLMTCAVNVAAPEMAHCFVTIAKSA